jgi:transcriptional regulator with XRE-family HTH domain
MKREIDAVDFGRRLKERRVELGLSQPKLAKMAKLAKMRGFSQSNIAWLEKGIAKDPRTQAEDLAGLLRTTAEWLLWETGTREVGPPIMSDGEFMDGYNLLPPEDRAEFSELMAKRLALLKKARKRS